MREVESKSRLGERALAHVILATLLFHVPGFSLLPISVFVGSALLLVIYWRAAMPIWWVTAAAGVALLSGFLLHWLRATQGYVSGEAFTVATVVMWIVGIAIIPTLGIWALARVDMRMGVILMLLGGLVGATLLSGLEWKGSVGMYASGLLLVILARRPALAVVALGGVLMLSGLSDARYMAIAAVGSLVVAALTTATPRRYLSNRARFGRLVFALAAVAVLGLLIPSSGLLGAEAQARTLDQLSKPANLVTSARVEWAATGTLMSQEPIGIGVGIRAQDAQVLDAVNSVQLSGGDYRSSYFTRVVFGDRVDLHSITANLWFHFGIAGLLLVIILAIILLRGLAGATRFRRELGFAGPFLMLGAMWDLFFSPMADVDRMLAGLVLALWVLLNPDQPHRRSMLNTTPRATTITPNEVRAKSRSGIA